MLDIPASGQQPAANSFQGDAVESQASTPQQVRQELESLRDSYRRRLQALDDQMQYVGFDPAAKLSDFRDVGHSPRLFPTHGPSANSSKKGYWMDGFLGDGLQITLGGGRRLKLYGYARGDLIYANSQLSNTVIPFFAVSEDPANTVGPNSVPVPDNDDQFNVNVRLTRLGLDSRICVLHVSTMPN